jgi:hypothetical protein
MNMLVSTLAVSASLVGLAKATVQGFDISSYQPNVDFSAAYSSGARFVIIKVCPLSSQRTTILTVLNRQPKAQPTSTQPSPTTTSAPQTPASSAAGTTLRIQTPALAQLKQNTSSPTAAAGPATESLCLVCWILNTTPAAQHATVFRPARW